MGKRIIDTKGKKDMKKKMVWGYLGDKIIEVFIRIGYIVIIFIVKNFLI